LKYKKAIQQMKRKMFLPLLAVVLAAAGAFASQPLAQMAWFHVSPNSSDDGFITNTTKECAVGRDVQCLIGTEEAYDSPENAANQNSAGLLKYSN
jgi:hypothetical protein